MLSLGRVSRINVLTALRDHDLQGAAEFREALGFDRASDEVLVVRGKKYDARAVLAYAHGKATGDYLGPDEVSAEALKVLADLEFTVATLAELSRPKPTATTRARTPRAAKPASSPRSRPEPQVKLCPTCFMQLSVVGTCDNCD